MLKQTNVTDHGRIAVHKRRLLELLRAHRLRMLNGRTLRVSR